MSFTVHWANTLKELERPVPIYRKRSAGESYKNRICYIATPFKLQSDILFPNAVASIENSDTDILDPSARRFKSSAIGCTGDRLDAPFPYESRTPVPLPLLMYPAKPAGTWLGDQDICAVPVMNWESYVIRLKSIGRRGLKRRKDSSHKDEDQQSSNCPDPSSGNKGSSRKMSISEMQSSINESESDRRDLHDAHFSGHSSKTLFTPSSADQKVKSKSPKTLKLDKPCRKIPKVIGFNQKADERKLVEHKRNLDNSTNPIVLKRPAVRKRKNAVCLSKATEKKLRNPPNVKVMGTWNYLYSGRGCCDWSYDFHLASHRNVFVGNGSKLRVISLKPAKKSNARGFFSYGIKSIWEEEEIPSNVIDGRPSIDDPLSNQIYQIKALRNKKQVGVRRGKSIEIYKQETLPVLIASIPNIGYGFVPYSTKRRRRGLSRHPSPFLTSFDFNTNFAGELVMTDEHAVIQFVDIELRRCTYLKEHQNDGRKVTSLINGRKSKYREPEKDVISRFTLNDACGVSYLGGHPEVVVQYADSKICIHDKRVKRTKCTEVFNLRSSDALLRISDQEDFVVRKKKVLHEYLSSFVPSQNPLYYYVGTTNRFFLMDIRVVNNPVVKFSHNLLSPPVYADVIASDNFETLVAQTQRNTEVLCATFDHAHTSCWDRSECSGFNPILGSLPKHLMNSREFFSFSLVEQCDFPLEKDLQKVKRHCYAWPTGMCLMQTPDYGNLARPPPFCLLSSNAFGDVFLQEWLQTPMREEKRLNVKDARVKLFIEKWRDSMITPYEAVSSVKIQPRRTDCSLLVESVSRSLKKSVKVRTKPCDSFTPHALINHRVTNEIPSLQKQLAAFNSIELPRVKKFLDVWSATETHDNLEVRVEQWDRRDQQRKRIRRDKY